ncbi:MAG: helix-turn-helix transcriptional regulator [Oscillospiraceae bacterium]|nr:helix-turn-helix transcriptional regulator [Oscillospiraceae bacterium]
MKKIEFYEKKNIIAERLKQVRKEKHITQSELAARLQVLNVNIDQQMISKIEKNDRQVTDYEVACICECLKIEPAWMLQDYRRFLE